MPKYAVVFRTRTKVVEATDAKEALRKAIMLGLTTWKTDAGFKGTVLSENVWVHELDDGEEFKISGNVDIKVDAVADPDKPVLDVQAEEYPVEATPPPKKARMTRAKCTCAMPMYYSSPEGAKGHCTCGAL